MHIIMNNSKLRNQRFSESNSLSLFQVACIRQTVMEFLKFGYGFWFKRSSGPIWPPLWEISGDTPSLGKRFGVFFRVRSKFCYYFAYFASEVPKNEPLKVLKCNCWIFSVLYDNALSFLGFFLNLGQIWATQNNSDTIFQRLLSDILLSKQKWN